MNTRNKIYIFSGLTILGLSYFGYRGIKRQQTYKYISKKISESSVIDNTKANEVLNGIFHENLGNKAHVILPETKKREIADKLFTAFYKPILSLNPFNITDEEAIYSIFNSLKDKVAISQIAAYYKIKRGISLRNQLEKSLWDSEYQKIIRIINSKKDVRWLT